METGRDTVWRGEAVVAVVEQTVPHSCLLYTSDAADDLMIV